MQEFRHGFLCLPRLFRADSWHFRRLSSTVVAWFWSGILLTAGWTGWNGTILLAAPTAEMAAKTPPVTASDTIDSTEIYAPPSVNELKTKVFAWIGRHQSVASPAMKAVAPLWEFQKKPDPEQLFDVLMRTFYLVDPETRELVDHCRDWAYSPALLHVQLPSKSRNPDEPLLTNNVRYFLARHLTLLTAYNDALPIFESIQLKDVVDPAGCLFHRAVCEHHLLMKQQGLKTLNLLLNQTQDVPLRYQKLAELMKTDLEGVEEKTLGEVARQMKDVQRRLSLQQTGKGVQQVEDKIIATLDELIKKMEDQQNQSSSSSGGGSSGGSQSNPAGDSYLGGVPAPGLTDPKKMGAQDRWGDLPPKAKEAAKNMLDQQFPAHYRQAVEEYLKKLAERPAP